MKRDPFVIADDDLWPRDAEHRYRLYAVRGEEREVLGATDSAGGIGEMIVALDADEGERGRKLYDRGRLGILDVLPDGKPSPAGEWLILPWDRGGR